MKEHCKEHKNNQSNKALRKLKENNELKSVKVGVVTKFIKDEIENTVDSADVITMILSVMSRIESLDSDKICMTY